MKKIIFVEKDNGRVDDPVSAYFVGRKNASVAKSGVKESNIGKERRKDEPFDTGNIEKTNTAMSIKSPMPINRVANTKQKKPEEIKSSKAELLSLEEPKEEIEPISTKTINSGELSEPSIAMPNKPDNNKQIIDKLNKQIREFQAREDEYLRQLEEWKEKEEKFIKDEQKLAKLQKEAKSNAQRQKEQTELMKTLKEKEETIKELMKGETVPFNKKREILFHNQIQQLKKTNKELVQRIKNYKGTDLVELAIQRNRDEITHDLKDNFETGTEGDKKNEINAALESNIAQLVNRVNDYLTVRLSGKCRQLAWSEESKFLFEIVHIAENISLQYLQEFWLCPLPNCNQDCQIIINKSKNINSDVLTSLVDRFEVNIIISKENAEIIEELDRNNQEKQSIALEISRSKSKYKQEQQNLLKIYKIRANYTETLLVQCLSQIEMIKQWLKKTMSKLLESVKDINKTIVEIKDIVELGESGKESLLFFMQTNIDKLTTKFPNLSLKITELQSDYAQLEKYSSEFKQCY